MVDNEQETIEQDDYDFSDDDNADDVKPPHPETFRIAILVFISLALLVFAAPYFLNNSALKFQLIQKLSQSLQTKLEIHGDVRVALLPHPSVIAKDVVLQNYTPGDSEISYDLYAKSVKVQFPVFSFSDDAPIDKIIFSDAIMTGYHSENKAVLRQDDLTKILTDFSKAPAVEDRELGEGISSKIFSVADISSSVSSKTNLPEIVVKNGRTILYDKFLRKREVNSINAQIKFSVENIAAQGDFISQNIDSKFNLTAVFNSKSGKKDTIFDLVSPVLEMHVKGNFLSPNQGLFKSDFVGNVTVQIMELKSFYQSYIDSNGVIPTKLKYNSKPINISAEINSEAHEIAVSKVKIASDVVSGSGQAYFNLATEVPIADLFLDLENFDLDEIWSNEVVAKVAPSKKLIPKDTTPKEPTSIKAGGDVEKTTIIDNEKNISSDIEEEKSKTDVAETDSGKIDLGFTKKIKNIDLTAEILVKKIKYLSGEIRDANIYFNASGDSNIMVMPAIFKIPGGGVLRVGGVFDNSTATSKFIGKFDVHGRSLKEIFRWLKIESQNLKSDVLNDYKSYSDILILPNSVAFHNLFLTLNSSKNEFSESEFVGEMKFENDGKAVNSSGRIHVNSFNLDDHFLISGQNTYLSPGMLLRKLFWLNDVSSSNDFDLSFDKLIYKKEEFGEQSFKFMIRRGYIEVLDLHLQSPKTDLKTKFFVDISDQNPRLSIKLDAKKFHYETPRFKGDESGEANLFDQFFAMPSLDGFGGRINIDISNAEIDGVKINSAALSGRLNNGNIENAKFDAEFYGGVLSYKGVLGLKISKTINGNFSFTNADLRPLLSDLFGIDNISGVGNFAANITSIANSRNEFSKNLRSELKFNANVPAVKGYGLSDLVKKMFALRHHKEDLRNPEEVLFNPNAKTVFKQATGTLKVNSGKDGKLRIRVSAPAVNGILSGKFSAQEGSVDLLFNAIFLTGNENSQTPINIATNLKGKTSDIKHGSNIAQVRQYLGLPPLKNNIAKAPRKTARKTPVKTTEVGKSQ